MNILEVDSLLVNAKQAAALLCISGRTLWTLTNQKEIPSLKIGRAVRYDRRDLLNWIENQKTNRR